MAVEIIKDKLYTFENFMSESDCNVLLEYVKKHVEKGYYKVTNNGFYQNIFGDKTIIGKYRDFVRDNVPIPDATISDLVFLTYYPPGKALCIHQDNKRGKEKYKLLIYLNTVPQGGETIFYNDPPEGSLGETTPFNDFVEFERIKPIKGNAVLFHISLFHSGAAVIEGEKYAFGFRLH